MVAEVHEVVIPGSAAVVEHGGIKVVEVPEAASGDGLVNEVLDGFGTGCGAL